MKPGWRRGIVTLACLAGLATGAVWLRACFGPDTSVVFTWERHPDLPMERFAAGRIGILQPFYARSYLVVAYRELMDRPLSAMEREEAVDLWDRRLNGNPNYLATPVPEAEADDAYPASTWLKARAEFMHGPPPVIHRENRDWERQNWMDNIQGGAFRTALRTLAERSKRWGRKDPRLRLWIQAQDQVFASTPEHPAIPAPLDAESDPQLRQDRAYQRAAARFYAQDFDAAIADFRLIMQDRDSPWNQAAAYLVARAWYRKGTRCEATRPDEAKRAFQEAMAIARSCPENFRLHPFARSLGWQLKEGRLAEASGDPEAFEFATYCLAKASAALADPPGRTRELADQLSRVDGAPDFGIDLGDYTILLDRQIQWEDAWDSWNHVERWWTGAKPPEQPRSIPKELLQDDLTDWVYSFRELGSAAYSHAFERWQGAIGTIHR